MTSYCDNKSSEKKVSKMADGSSHDNGLSGELAALTVLPSVIEDDAERDREDADGREEEEKYK